jgi:integrase
VLRLTGTTRPKPYKGAPTWGCEGRANSMFTFLRGFFLWCEDKKGGDLLDDNPCAGLRQPYKKRERERLLSPDEIRYFWQATSEIGFPVGPIAQLLLLTAQRRGEIANAYGGQVDRTQRMLTVPIMSTKPRRGHLVPLSTAALGILDALPHGDPRDLLFPRSARQPNLLIWGATFAETNKRIHARMVQLAAKISVAVVVILTTRTSNGSRIMTCAGRRRP